MNRQTFATWLKCSKGSMPKAGVVAKSTRWYDIGVVDFTTNALHVGDRWYHGDDGEVQIKIRPGPFRVQGRGAAFGKHHRVAGVRVFADGTSPHVGKTLGEIGVDSWGILIGDIRDLYRDLVGPSAQEKWFKKNLFGKYARGVEIKSYKVGDRSVPFVTAFTGLGSGGYPAKALVAGRKTVGVEVEFIEEGFQLEIPGAQQVSLLDLDEPGFKAWALPDGGEVSCWVGGELVADGPVYIWSDAAKGPVSYRVRQKKAGMIKDWSRMARKRGGGATFGAVEVLGKGAYEIDFEINGRSFSPLKFELK